MARTRTSTPAVPATPSATKTATKTHRAPRRVAKRSGAAVLEFNPAEHQHEIAVAAYYCWLERGDAPGSPEQDWLRAEAEVRSRYA
jgi:hypothetical protein